MKRTRNLIAIAPAACSFLMLLNAGLSFCQTNEKTTAQIAQADKIDSYISQKMESYRIPGAVIAAVDKGKVVLKKAYGKANLETDTPVKINSVFELASLTKPFTATAIMLLVEAGKVELDNSIGTYIDNAPDSWKNITVRHLLTHTAGFPGEVPVQWEGSPLMNVTARQQFDFIARAPLLFPPGERSLYSDPGYILLGMIIEKASGQSYREFVQKRIFEPLQMTDSSVLDQWRIIKNRVS
ncbi:MAG TPA: serine hydrolase domain-containing protein, partial [Blastocatellia bacterium]